MRTLRAGHRGGGAPPGSGGGVDDWHEDQQEGTQDQCDPGGTVPPGTRILLELPTMSQILKKARGEVFDVAVVIGATEPRRQLAKGG